MSEAPIKKDLWDRLTALATILVPAAIALAGHFIAQGLKQAEIASEEMRLTQEISSEERRAEQSRAIAEANTKIAQASFINTMMKSLTSPQPQERKLAVEAVLIALPEQGPALVRTIAKYDEDKTVQTAAETSLEQRVETLIRKLFSEDSAVRIGAAQDLIQGWRNDPNAAKALVDFASENTRNSNGIYNTMVVLNEFSLDALKTQRQRILSLAGQVKASSGAKTNARATKLLSKLEGAEN